MARVPPVVLTDAAMRGGRRLTLELHVNKDTVPGILLLPLEPRPAAAALLLHGYSSDKERMASSAGHALLELGVASLAIDLPLHGERVSAESGAGISPDEFRNPIALARRWRTGEAESHAAIAYLASLPEIDPHRLALIGYSMGAFLGAMVAADSTLIRALVLAAGGDLPESLPYARIVRALVDPVRAVRRFAGRPLLMVHGRNDRTIKPSQAERLFAAAGDPKEIFWYPGGHWLSEAAVRQAATWLAEQLYRAAPTPALD